MELKLLFNTYDLKVIQMPIDCTKVISSIIVDNEDILTSHSISNCPSKKTNIKSTLKNQS
jgi:hypothetical protein